jgi:hypothetical protein
MKHHIILLFLAITCLLFGQNIYEGKIIDSNTKEPLAYVNIGIIERGLGTVSDRNGYFKIHLDEKYDEDTLRFSMIGYHNQDIKITDFKNKFSDSSTIALVQKIIELPEITIRKKNFKRRTLGRSTKNYSSRVGFVNNQLGSELGAIIKVKEVPAYVESINTYIVESTYDTLRFRVNFYDLKDGMPNNIIQKENIFFTTTLKKGWLYVDLTKYDIVLKEDFCVTLEWLEDLGNGKLTFALLFKKPDITGHIIRHSSQDKWTVRRNSTLDFRVDVQY